MPTFIPGIRLGELFYRQAVRPVLDRHWPALPHAAAFLGSGSDVLGYDTEMSRDHNWGPRLQLLLRESDVDAFASEIVAVLRDELPRELHGYPTSYGAPRGDGTVALEAPSNGPVSHDVIVSSVDRWVNSRLGAASWRAMTVVDWLCATDQKLLELTAGAVYHDDLGELTEARKRFTWYPDGIWRYLLAAGWMRVAEWEPFVGRCGDVGDDLGSRLIAAALARDIMRLCFLMERMYAPYAKWFGTAFDRLACAPRIRPPLNTALTATAWPEREAAIVEALSAVAWMHNDLGISEPLSPEPRPFHGRPYRVIDAERFAKAISARITDEDVLRLPAFVGSAGQVSDNDYVLTRNELRNRLRTIWDEPATR